MFQSLPAPVKRRIKALKKIQLEATKIEAKFYEEIHALEMKYHQMYVPLYEKRASITKGNVKGPCHSGYSFHVMSAIVAHKF